MTFIVGSIIIGAGAAIGGAVIGAKGATKSAEIAAAGSDREIDFLTESRDLARSDVEPYREAGYTALDALMSMTGLKGTGGGSVASSGSGGGISRPPTSSSPVLPPGVSRDSAYAAYAGRAAPGIYAGVGRSDSPLVHKRLEGGPLYGREHGGALYNVNEMGPESVYQNGSYTRSNLPQTIPPNPTGYVAPNIQGRLIGGSITEPEPVGWGGPNSIPGTPGGTDQPLYVPPPVIQVPPTAPPGGMTPGQTGGGTTVDNNTGQPVNDGPFFDGTGPRENPGGVEGGYNFMTDPGYAFRIGEGQRALERGAAARGGLLSGGFGRKLTRYAQDYASNEYTNVYNRISNIAGLGQVSAQGSGNFAMAAGAGMGSAAQAGANASAYGRQGQYNAAGVAIDQLGQLPWGDLFNRGGSGGGGGGVDTRTN